MQHAGNVLMQGERRKKVSFKEAEQEALFSIVPSHAKRRMSYETMHALSEMARF
jgi:hypothetical protein